MNYYIADTHFGHTNIIRFDERPFKNTLEMEQTIIKNWNERVTNKDTVYIIGDFCWGLENEWIRILDQLNGAKVLIRGNHDLKHPSAKLKSKFRKICDYEEIKDNGKTIIMSHCPSLFFNHSGDRNAWHFCGHTHNRTAEEFKRQEYVWDLIHSRKEDYNNRGHIINVGCMMDYVDYTPRTADKLIAWWHSYYENENNQYNTHINYSNLFSNSEFLISRDNSPKRLLIEMYKDELLALQEQIQTILNRMGKV